jgi:hypothetical protein
MGSVSRDLVVLWDKNEIPALLCFGVTVTEDEFEIEWCCPMHPLPAGAILLDDEIEYVLRTDIPEDIVPKLLRQVVVTRGDQAA